MKKTTRDLQEILEQLYYEGYQPNHPHFEFLYTKRRVERCQELHLVSACQVCIAFDSCELAKKHLRNAAEAERQKHVEMEKQKKAT